MGFRTIIVESRCKLEYSLNYLVYRTVSETKRINLNEINTIIIQTTACSITSALLVNLIEKKIKVVFCDDCFNPCFEAVPYYGDSISSKRITEQVSWKEETKASIWKLIVIEKIKNQSALLRKYGKKDDDKVLLYCHQVEPGDVLNAEGHAAKIYFNRLFFQGFSRNTNHAINKYLNYGYTILLSQFNKAIVSKGYVTQLGIHHKNDFNQFNLSCDLMEPFRIIVDDLAHIVNDDNFKEKMIEMLNIDVEINNSTQTLANAIQIYVASVFSALNTNSERISFFSKYEL